jgi:hypothetical protein
MSSSSITTSDQPVWLTSSDRTEARLICRKYGPPVSISFQSLPCSRAPEVRRRSGCSRRRRSSARAGTGRRRPGGVSAMDSRRFSTEFRRSQHSPGVGQPSPLGGTRRPKGTRGAGRGQLGGRGLGPGCSSLPGARRHIAAGPGRARKRTGFSTTTSRDVGGSSSASGAHCRVRAVQLRPSSRGSSSETTMTALKSQFGVSIWSCDKRLLWCAPW